MFLSIIFKFHLKHLPIFCHVNVLVGPTVFHFYTVVISGFCFKEIHIVDLHRFLTNRPKLDVRLREGYCIRALLSRM